MNISIFSRRGLADQRPADAHPEEPQARHPPPAGRDTSTTSYPLWTLDPQTVTRLLRRGRRRPAASASSRPTGKPGSVLMFPRQFSCTPRRPNITALTRAKIVYLTLCAVSNHITRFTRAEWIAHRDFEPIVPRGRRTR